MGKAKITQKTGDAEYRVQYLFDVHYATQQIAYLDKAINEADIKIAQQIDLRDAQQIKVDGLVAQLNTMIANFALCGYTVPPCPTFEAQRSAIVKKIEELDTQKLILFGHSEAVQRLTADKLADIAKRGFLSNYATEEEFVTLESADWIEDDFDDQHPDPVGETVGTIELMGAQGSAFSAVEEPKLYRIIRPLYDKDDRKYDPQRDHAATPTGSMSEKQAFSVMAQFPYAVKYNPKYLAGNITDLDYETGLAKVECHGNTPNAPAPTGFENDPIRLDGVGIDYMDCDETAFKVGDYVVVEFRNVGRDRPRIIGFVRNPRKCTLLTLNGAFCFNRNTTFSAFMSNNFVAEDMYAHPELYVVRMNGRTMPWQDKGPDSFGIGHYVQFYDATATTPFAFWAQFSSAPYFSPCFKPGVIFRCASEGSTPPAVASISLHISKGSRTFVDATLTPSFLPDMPTEFDGYEFDNSSLCKSYPLLKQKGFINGVGIRRQEYQKDFFLVNGA